MGVKKSKIKDQIPKMAIRIGKLKLKNPVMLASGTYEYNEITGDLIDTTKLGAIIAKTITLRPKAGNAPPRTSETPAGMLNAIGLQNKGLDAFLSETLPSLKRRGAPVIASIAGSTTEEFVTLAARLDKAPEVSGIELNLSCPNLRIKKLFAQDAKITYRVVAETRKASKKTLIAKLSPNVTDIRVIARASEKAGADAISLVNTFLAIAIDIDKRQPVLGSVTGGLSGPAIKPIALRMVYEASRAVSVPVIGMGGIASGPDAVEFLIAGATAVAVGTGSFVRPELALEVSEYVKAYLAAHNIKNITALIGSLSAGAPGVKPGKRP